MGLHIEARGQGRGYMGLTNSSLISVGVFAGLHLPSIFWTNYALNFCLILHVPIAGVLLVDRYNSFYYSAQAAAKSAAGI